MADAERWAAGIPGPAYAIDDETAISVVDGVVEVVSEGLETVHAVILACARVRECALRSSG